MCIESAAFDSVPITLFRGVGLIGEPLGVLQGRVVVWYCALSPSNAQRYFDSL